MLISPTDLSHHRPYRSVGAPHGAFYGGFHSFNLHTRRLEPSRANTITAVAPSRAPLAIPWRPGRGQVSLSFLRLATLCLRHRTPIDSALRQVLPCLLWLLLTTHGKLYSVCLVGRTSVSPPRVRTCSFPPCACCIYTSDSVSLGALSCHADLPILACLMQFLFVRPVVCLRLPSDSASRRTPLSLAMRLALPPALDLSPVRTRSCRAH